MWVKPSCFLTTMSLNLEELSVSLRLKRCCLSGHFLPVSCLFLAISSGTGVSLLVVSVTGCFMLLVSTGGDCPVVAIVEDVVLGQDEDCLFLVIANCLAVAAIIWPETEWLFLAATKCVAVGAVTRSDID